MHPVKSHHHDVEAGSQLSSGIKQHKGLLLKRRIASCSALIALWCVLGSILSPYCSYGFIWRFSFSDNPCWLGLSAITDHPYLMLVIIILLILPDRFQKMLFPEWKSTQFVQNWIDQNWKPIISFSIVTCIVTMITVYVYANDTYDFWIAAQSNEITLGDMSLKEEPTIEAPIDFLFLDDKSVEALYNQIEPELIEKHRTISNSDKASGKAGIEAGGVTAAVEAGRGRDSTGTYERVEFAPARRCLAVMKFVADSKRATYYTNFKDWRRVRERYQEIAERAQPGEMLTPIGVATVPKTTTTPTTKQDAIEKHRITADEKDADYKTAFLKELQELEGLVFVRGQFSQISETQPGTLVLTTNFAGAPKKVLFKVVVPNDSRNIEALRLASGANLVIFGRITKPLTDSGTVEIRPFAIF